jgi:hypothetical protein
MLGSVHEVVVRGEQGQFVPAAELNEKCIDCSDLHTSSTAGVAYLGGCDVIVPIGRNDWQRLKPFNYCRYSTRSVEALQEFLKHKPSGYHRI